MKAIHCIDPKCYQLSLEKLYRSVKTLISRTIEDLALSKTLELPIHYLIYTYRTYLGEKPEIIAGSAIGVALKLLSSQDSVTNFSISKSLNVTASTIYSRVNNFPISRIPNTIREKLAVFVNNNATMDQLIPENNFYQVQVH
jgi:hypothetical protein